MTELEESEPATQANGSIMESLVNYFRENDWQYELVVHDSRLVARVRGNNGDWSCYAQAREEEGQFVFYSVLPFEVIERKRAAVAEYISRANWGLVSGSFEMDFSTGETRFRTSIELLGEPLCAERIENLVMTNVVMMDRYLPGLMRVIYNDLSPEEAIAQIENESVSSADDTQASN